MILKINFLITIYTLILNSWITFSYKFPEDCGVPIVNVTESDWRIVGGAKTVSGEFPWQVVLNRQFYDEDKGADMVELCGGTIINENWILTAAHCVTGKDRTQYEIYLGVHDFTKREGTEVRAKVEKIISHERYVKTLTRNDIALVKLDGKIDFKLKHKFLRPICLASPATESATNCFATGFGDRSASGPNSKILLKVYEPIYNLTRCRAKLRYVDSTNVCAGGQNGGGFGVCMGDSGGPLQCKVGGRWYQVGITSWGIPCAKPGLPDVYTKVSAYYDWIVETIEKS